MRDQNSSGQQVQEAAVRTCRHSAKDKRGKDRQVLNAVQSALMALIPVTALGQISLPFGNSDLTCENSGPSVHADGSEEHKPRPAETSPTRESLWLLERPTLKRSRRDRVRIP